MALFQNSVLNKYLKGLDQTEVSAAFEQYTAYFHHSDIQENIRNSKEEQFQATFLNELFVKILGYTLKPNPNFNLATEFKNVKGAKKADGAILKNNKAIAVIELKGTNTTDLDKIESQAFGYKNNQPTAVYVITSNFEKLRFYIDDAVDYLDFNLFNLTESQFKILYLCLHKDHIYSNLPHKIKSDSTLQEENITKKLYKDYSTFKKTLFNDLVQNNPNHSKLVLFKKSQKLLDRFLFIFFAEDKGLLPPNSVSQIVETYETLIDLDNKKPLYTIFQQYFNYIDKGRPARKNKVQIFAFNGGLFYKDDMLDNLIISDDVLMKHTVILSTYDFDSEVDVNILGHIFEHSLNEIDEMTAEIEGQTIDKNKTKRKKDGVFYTPKYITKYIVENTLGKLCEEKKTALNIVEEDYAKDRKGRKKATLKKLNHQLEQYRQWLLALTICDPACGSGAFLNQALDFLIEEHHYIDELQTKLLGGGFVFPNVENSILENNLYGVDINEESVEIAKLSLWLRTVKKGRQLTSLNNNIKCGNSLIDDVEVAGDKAFKWEEEFPKVFKNGGFDVVVGNPPYVRQELLKPFKPHFKKNYKTFQGTADLFTYFIELSVDKLLNSNGLYSIIVGNKWIQAKYGKPLRQWMKQKQIIEIIDFGGLPVFSDATTYTCILSLSPKKSKPIFEVTEPNTLDFVDLDLYIKNHKFSVNTETLDDNGWALVSIKVSDLLNKLKNTGISLKTYVKNRIFRGILTGLNEAFVIDKETKKRLINEDPKSIEVIKPFLAGKNINRYAITFDNTYLILIPSGWTNTNREDTEGWLYFQKTYPAISNHLKKFEEKAKKRYDKGDYWWELRSCDYYKEFEKPKILWPGISNKVACFALDYDGYYGNDNNQLIIHANKILLTLLNSSVSKFFLSNTCDQVQGGFFRLKMIYIKEIPLPNKNFDQQKELEILSDNQINNTNLFFNSKASFLRMIIRRFQLEKPSKNLQKWHTLTFTEFVKELKKKKIKLSLSEEGEWEDYFEAEKAKAQEIKAVIAKTDQEIDKMVYELYGLTNEEIEIVENS